MLLAQAFQLSFTFSWSIATSLFALIDSYDDNSH